MQKSCSADKSTMYVDNIRQSSERMREMLNTLLDFFRLDNGKEQPNLSPCRISAITHILETEFMPIAMNKGLTLIVESHTDAVVLTDKERILQIGNNLLSNAIKFTDNGSVSLAADYDNGLLKLIVEDTGTGMTEDEQQRVFGAFERLSNAAAKDGWPQYTSLSLLPATSRYPTAGLNASSLSRPSLAGRHSGLSPGAFLIPPVKPPFSPPLLP